MKATFDGELYRGTLTRMGTEDHLLLIRKDIRTKIGKQPGDTVHVSVELDTEPRVVEIPAELSDALKPFPKARVYFESLSYTHQKEYVQWIAEAKREETKVRRIEKAVAMLRDRAKP